MLHTACGATNACETHKLHCDMCSPSALDPGAIDDSRSLRAALRLATLCDGAEVYLPPGGYYLGTTVRVPDGIAFVGGAGLRSHMQFMDTPQASIYGPTEGPALLFENVDGGNSMSNIMVHGQSSAIIMRNVALVRFTDVGLKAAVNSDKVDSTKPGCNVVLNSTNAPLVIENSYWLWFERCSFQDLGVGASLDGKHMMLGQRPVIILRGTDPPSTQSNVYLTVFRDVVLRGGGVQYQQLTDLKLAQTGYYEFQNVVLESTAMPLLDIQSDPAVQHFAGVESITVIDFQSADSMKTNYANVQNLNTVIQLNCSQPGCTLDGVTIMGASADGSPYNQYRVGHAVRVFAGHVRSITVLDSSHSGAVDVVDHHGVPFGSFVSKTEGGLLLVGENCTSGCTDARLSRTGTNPMPNNDDSVVGRSSGHALLFGLSGETTGRLAVEADGSVQWGGGRGATFDTTLHRSLTSSMVWDPPALSTVSSRTKVRVPLVDVVRGDVVSASHTGIDGEQDVDLGAVAADGYVVVKLRLVGDESVDVGPGTLRVVAGQWSGNDVPSRPPPARPPSNKSTTLVFHPPVPVDSGSGWGDTLHTLYRADRWNESVVYSFGVRNIQRGGFVSVSTSGGSSWDMSSSASMGGNWSAELCSEDAYGAFATVRIDNGVLHSYGTAQGSGATVGSYTSWNSSTVSVIRRATGVPEGATAQASCESHPVTFRGLPDPVYCNQTGWTADCFWSHSGSSVRLSDGLWLQTAAVPWLGGEFGPSASASGVFVFRSMDSFQWDYLATVARASDFPKSGEGPNENAMSLTSAGNLLVVMRMDGNDGVRWGDHTSKNFFSSRSTDMGKTWTKASEIRDLRGKGIGTARPQLLLLGGSLLLTGSRVLSSDDSDYYLWHDSDGTGNSFDAHSLTYHHNELVKDPKKKIGVWCNGTNITGPGQQCGGYTSIVPLDEENALVMYSVETVDFGAFIFTMRVTLQVDSDHQSMQ